MTDIHAEWKRLWGRNAGEIMSFTIQLVEFYWKTTDDLRPRVERKAVLDAYRRDCWSGDYHHLIGCSRELILQETEIELPQYPHTLA